MSNALDRVRAKFKVPTAGTRKGSESPSAASAGSKGQFVHAEGIPSAGSAGAEPGHIETSEAGAVAFLSPAQAAARQQVLQQLAANPTVQRAFANRFENGSLIVTLAVRDLGTCELLIPAERFNAGAPDDYAALLACISMEGKATSD